MLGRAIVILVLVIVLASKYPRLTDWVEENIGETLTFYRCQGSKRHHYQLE